MNTEFAWIGFYREFADALRPFAADRATLIARLKRCYEKINVKFPKMDYDDQVRDIDPFTVFGLFNKQIKDANRSHILSAIKEEFEIKAEVPKSFAGIPVLNNRKACYFPPTNSRGFGENDIDNLWHVFDLAIRFADGDVSAKEELVSCWDKVLGQHDVRWNLTMGFFWIRPQYFVNLDQVNREYLMSDAWLSKCVNEIAPKVLNGFAAPSGKQYLAICEAVVNAISNRQVDYGSLPELSHRAWQDSKNKKRKEASKGREKAKDDKEAIAFDRKDGQRRVWLCALGKECSEWEDFKKNEQICIGWDELGDLSKYQSKEAVSAQILSLRGDNGKKPNNDTKACWEFAHVMKPGDVVLAKDGGNLIKGFGIVNGQYRRDETRSKYKNVIPCKWIVCKDVPCGNVARKTLTDISKNTELIRSLFLNYGLTEEALDQIPIDADPDGGNAVDGAKGEAYTKDRFLSEVFMSEDEYERIKRLLVVKKNIIFQGAPGVGKTFVAKKFATSIIGANDPKHIEFVQFHQSYSYEDFIGGYKPSGNGFEYRNGVFYDFCLKARKDPQGKYFFIIDEINRGNLSKIFGELLMLIEADKREEEVRLTYTRESFVVPDNVYLIGMMNTADRSLAMIDYALRRRFSFVTMEPKFTDDKFKKMMARTPDAKRDSLVACVIRLNEAIRNDSGLGKGFEIGHSYFCGGLPPSDIVEFELIPLLEEYWYDASEKVGEWTSKLREAVR